MNNLIEKAKEELINNNYTLVLYDGINFITSSKRGVRPLLEVYDLNKDVSNYVAADKVIGKGAAFLYVLLKIKEINTNIISKPALEVLNNNKISCHYQLLVDYIINHDKTGYCPIETAVININDANVALPVIRETLKKLNEK